MPKRKNEIPFAELPREALELYGQAVQVIAAADGRLTRDERELVFEDARRLGVPADIIEGWLRFNWRSETVASILARFAPYAEPRLTHRIIYSAVRVAVADELFTIDERAAIDEAADILGIAPEEVEAMTALVRMEMGIAVLRRGLLL